jgi:DNA methylase
LTEDWTFAHLKRVETLWGPHGYHRYPAKFIPQLVHRIIEVYSAPGDLVGDPFLGSATTGIEALRMGRRFWGSDISQVALLISRAKCIPICPQDLAEAWKQVDSQLNKVPRVGRRHLTPEEKEAITAIDIVPTTSIEERLGCWFPAQYRESLAGIFRQILVETEGDLRIFFLCGFSNILKRCSIWLSGSTKSQKDVCKVPGDPVEEFRRQIRDMIKRNRCYWDDLVQHGLQPAELIDQCCIRGEDARQLTLPDATLDLVVTSPPYAICYEYKEIHQLTQLWFEHYSILSPADSGEVWIGSKGVSHRTLSEASSCNTGSTLADAALAELSLLAAGNIARRVKREVRALHYYFQDMHAVLQEMARVIVPGKRLVLIIGERDATNSFVEVLY